MLNRVLITGFLPVCLFAQLTSDQRLFDFQMISSILAKSYAPYEWKRDRLGFDLYDTSPWHDRVRNAANDTEFLEICAEYVASLRDPHAFVQLASNFLASIPLSADIYDGRVLIDFSSLPRAAFPIDVGDEVVSLDGVPVGDFLRGIQRLRSMGNERSTRRFATAYLFARPQSVLPRAPEVGDVLTLVLRKANGEQVTHRIPWNKRGVPLRNLGPIPTPRSPEGGEVAEPWGDRQLRAVSLNARNPQFIPPAGFTPRLGARPTDLFFSGTYPAGGRTLGYLRLGSFSIGNAAAALAQLQEEVVFLQRNTDGLILDIMSNYGGNCFGNSVLSLFMPGDYQVMGQEVRATPEILLQADANANSARIFGPAWAALLYQEYANQIRMALSENRGRTGMLPLCGPSFTSFAAPNAYTKPLIVVTDDLTSSWAETFAAAIQDNRRGSVFGLRTNGAGGSVTVFPAGIHSEFLISASPTIGVRQRSITTDDFGETAVLENVGVRPDIPYDPFTRDNLLQQGRPFVEAMTQAALREIAR